MSLLDLGPSSPLVPRPSPRLTLPVAVPVAQGMLLQSLAPSWARPLHLPPRYQPLLTGPGQPCPSDPRPSWQPAFSGPPWAVAQWLQSRRVLKGGPPSGHSHPGPAWPCPPSPQQQQAAVTFLPPVSIMRRRGCWGLRASTLTLVEGHADGWPVIQWDPDPDAKCCDE